MKKHVFEKEIYSKTISISDLLVYIFIIQIVHFIRYVIQFSSVLYCVCNSRMHIRSAFYNLYLNIFESHTI